MKTGVELAADVAGGTISAVDLLELYRSVASN
jgi:hypothetical protein